jgi:hypothetical protein
VGLLMSGGSALHLIAHKTERLQRELDQSVWDSIIDLVRDKL